MVQNTVFDAQNDTNVKVSQTSVPTFTTNIWRSNWVDVTAYRRLILALDMDQPSISSGVLIEQSWKTSVTDGAGGDADAQWWTASSQAAASDTNPVTTKAATYHTVISSECGGAKWARIVVEHAGAAPTAFEAYLVGVGIT